jgi:2-oxo-4-hydroxy-4-carboxy-5-ureidoimidazoline decarboxylase
MGDADMTTQKTPLRKLNMMNAHGFARVLGNVFEHSPWVAERAHHLHPFKSVADVHEKMCQTMMAASEEEKLALIRAHPDLVRRAAAGVGSGAGELSSESRTEQAAAGLDRLRPDEVDMFQTYNDAYRDQFRFPFIICARQNKKEAILAAFPKRLKNTREKEIATALAEICKIAQLRLADVIEEG